MTTILTLEPLGGPLMGGTMAQNFGGAGLNSNRRTTRPWLGCPTGTPVLNIVYPASLAPTSIPDGVRALDYAISGTSGNLLIAGHSEGAQVISRWLRTKAGAPGAPSASRVSFLLFGNPLRKHGGAGVGKPESDGQIGQATPTDTAYTVTDAKLRYDGWADWPTRGGVWATANATQDRFGINGRRAIHAMGYRTANLTDPARKTHTEGHTTFVLLPHAPLLRVPVAWIERSYNRPEH